MTLPVLRDDVLPITQATPLAMDLLKAGRVADFCSEAYCRLWQPSSADILALIVKSETGRTVGHRVAVALWRNLEIEEFDQYRKPNESNGQSASRLLRDMASTFDLLVHVQQPTDSIRAVRSFISERDGMTGMHAEYRNIRRDEKTRTRGIA